VLEPPRTVEQGSDGVDATDARYGAALRRCATALRYGVFQPFDVEQNIAAGTRYVTTLMWEFRGDLRLVAAAYHAGDRWIEQKQLNYRNPDVITYVQAVRRQYVMRKQTAARPSRRETR
jgi:soluble lytic murein transglycosylase